MSSEIFQTSFRSIKIKKYRGKGIIIHPKIETKLFLQIPGARKKLSQLSRQIILKSFSSVS